MKIKFDKLIKSSLVIEFDTDEEKEYFEKIKSIKLFSRQFKYGELISIKLTCNEYTV